MFIFDKEQKTCYSERLEACPSCQQVQSKRHLQINSITLFAIPLLPINKRIWLDCDHCHHQAHYPISFTDLKRHQQISWLLHFIGSIIITLALILYSQHHIAQQVYQQRVLTTPQANDLYFINYDKLHERDKTNYRYGIYKVSDIDGSQIKLLKGNYFYPRFTNLKRDIRSDKLILDHYFQRKAITASISQIQDWFAEGVIEQVERSANHMHLYGGIVILPDKLITPKIKRIKGHQQNQYGLSYYHAKEFSSALDYFLQAAELGHPYAQVNLAEMYRDGEGTSPKPQQALNWFLQAAKQNHSAAIREYQLLCTELKQCQTLPP